MDNIHFSESYCQLCWHNHSRFREIIELHDVYRALDILGKECDFIQSEVYKSSNFISKRNDKVLYYDCSNYYFEIEQEKGDKQYGKSKEHRPNPIIQMGLFMDGDGIPLAFSTFPENANEQTSLKPLEKKVLDEFGCQKFIYCSDAGLASEDIRSFNHMGERAFIVTQSIKKLKAEDKSWALNQKGFKRVSDDFPVSLADISEDDTNLYYKDEPYTTKEGEVADIHTYLDEEKIASEAQYDGLYAVCPDLLDDDVSDILKVSEGRWKIEECFRIMKTDFSARPVYLQNEDRIKAHFLICFLSLLFYRLLEKKMDHKYTCENILKTLKTMNFASIQEQGFLPLYKRE